MLVASLTQAGPDRNAGQQEFLERIEKAQHTLQALENDEYPRQKNRYEVGQWYNWSDWDNWDNWPNYWNNWVNY